LNIQKDTKFDKDIELNGSGGSGTIAKVALIAYLYSFIVWHEVRGLALRRVNLYHRMKYQNVPPGIKLLAFREFLHGNDIHLPNGK